MATRASLGYACHCITIEIILLHCELTKKRPHASQQESLLLYATGTN